MNGEGSAKAAVDAIALCQSLVERALEVVSSAPYWAYVSDKEWARLEIEGDQATLSWPETETNWDLTTIERHAVSFPASLLFVSTDELAFWKREQRAAYDRQQAKQAEADRKERERQERAAYEALKAKFG